MSQPEPVNPYAASQAADARRPAASSGRHDFERSYVARLTWADRRHWLRSIGPMRLITVIIAVQWAKNCYETATLWLPYVAREGVTNQYDAILFALAGAAVVHGLFVLYLCWLDWKCIDAIAEVTGGRTNSFSYWSELNYRLVWLGAVSAVLGLAIDLGNSVVSRGLITAAS
jgi:hypothetical protein